MNSLILGLKNLEYLAARFSKFKTPHSYGNFHRTVHTNYILFSNITKHFIIHDLRDSAQPSKNKDFGNVVDLEYDFDQLRVDDDDSTRTPQNTAFKEKREGRRNIRKMKCAEKPVQTKELKKVPLDKTGIEDEVVLELNEINTGSENYEVEKRNYKLLKDQNLLFRAVMTQFKSKKNRLKKGQVILEGKRLIQDALSAGHKPLKLFFSRFSDLRTLNVPEDVAVTQVPYKTLSLWSDVVTSQGVIGLFKIPEIKSKMCSNSIPLTVICDNIRDPGNLGSIIRIVAAVGGEELLLTTGCADIWDSKVLRAAAGAHFRLPIECNLSWCDIENKISDGTQIVLADNEIPTEASDSDKAREHNKIKYNSFKTSSELASSLPLHCYTSFEYKDQGAVIVLGGETTGLSDEAYNFAKIRSGSRVFIPMGNGTESLNSAISLGIISYEFRRQISVEDKCSRVHTEFEKKITSEDDYAVIKEEL